MPNPSSRSSSTPADWTDSLSGDDVLDILGPADSRSSSRSSNRSSHSPPRPTPAPLLPPRGQEDIPETAEELSRSQHVAAVYRVHENTSQYFRFPIPSLDRLAGAVAPGELWVLGGRQGNGKSLFLQNLAAWLLEQNKRVLYMGTEQNAPTLKIKQACVIAGVKARFILKPTVEERGSQAWADASRLVQDTLVWLNAKPQCDTLLYSNNRFISRESLTEWVEVACGEWGVEVVIVDHLHHMHHGEGRNPVDELTRTVHHAKTLADERHIAMLCASQIARTGGDEIKRHTPPSAEDFAGASAIERTADVMLSIWRPLRLDLDTEAMKDIRAKSRLGHAAEDAIYEPLTMGVRCVKDRLGDVPGTQTMLAVDNQRLVEMGRHAHATDYDSLQHFGRPK